ncbi:MAG: cadmium-translocating P-type ATPase, partial [Leadbetterella sp.]|nr:cadmium-translocating P-type ATPase [Leadbetterella sp.]
MAHDHIKEDSCCSPANEHKPHNGHHPDDGHHHGDGHSHDPEENSLLKLLTPSLISLVLLLAGIALDNWIPQTWFRGWPRALWYVCAYLPVGLPVIKDAFKSIKRGDFFSEFFLMSIATIGAFALAEYPEAVAVMLFYSVGEAFQSLAVSKAKGNIRALLDQRPDQVSVLRENEIITLKAETVNIGDIIRLKPGEKLGLDGELMSETASFNTSALTGESRPDTKKRGEVVLAGMINLNTLSLVKVTTAYKDSKLSKILELVQNATSQKAPTELFIRKFARIYTPIVVFLALAICLLPYLFVQDYVFRDWLYRALIFLVISCPCALVISIPLGYFGGIGAASRNGILVKGSNFLDVLAHTRHVVMDKTGTLTEGVFRVQEVVLQPGQDKDTILKLVNVLESHSTHPVATAIHEYAGPVDTSVIMENTKEIPGYGLKATANGKELLVGNFKLMDREGIAYDPDPAGIVYTVIAIAYDRKFAGYLTIADSIKPEAGTAIRRLHDANVKTTLLSGDKDTVVQYVAKELNVGSAAGDLLPEDKVNRVKNIKAAKETVAFVGDGVND